ncbi:alcohol dehydrogenase catalytic domain-containing protein [Gammaproteobacteria bacterium]|jgi:S-(hydroxymethyl)glutathione dehydrogenase/alcohol dehydrogenase|nr:alcohol dehydrogenase catalytic domain-containing protein [Gammaproteobacteria bacterium]
MNKKFKAAVLTEQKKPLEIWEIKDREVFGYEVAVKLISSCICGAQVNEFLGKKGPDKFLPHFMGHEGYGIVESIGEKVTNVKKGDFVILHWRPGKGGSIQGTKFETISGSSVGAGPVTTFSEYTVIGENRCTPIEPVDELKNVYPLLGCALPTAYGVLVKEAQVTEKNSILIFGAGGLGTALTFICDALDLQSPTVVDIFPGKKKQVERFGGKFVALEEIDEIKESKFDLVLETTGVGSIIGQTPSYCNKNGQIGLIGQSKINEDIVFSNFLQFYDGMKMFSSQGGLSDPAEDTHILHELLKVDIKKSKDLISHYVPIDMINEGFQNMKEPDCSRVGIKFEE